MKTPDTILDPLGEALHHLRLNGVFYCRSEFTVPWGLALPPFPGSMMFHIVMSGQCWLEVEAAKSCLLQPGDLALVSHGEGHSLAHEAGAPAENLFDLHRESVSDRYEILRCGGGGAITNILCGVVRFEDPAAHHLISLLPKVIHIEASNSPLTDWIQDTVRFMSVEATELRPGGETIITRLADILVIQAIRSWIAQAPDAQTGWLGALQDRQVGRAIALIHREPAREWTVASLAKEVAMSRSAFSARFTELAGEPPIRYLARWRMHVGNTWLKADKATLAEVADRLGYRSEAAFSRAFKRFMGISPGAVRRDSVSSGTESGPNDMLQCPLGTEKNIPWQDR